MEHKNLFFTILYSLLIFCFFYLYVRNNKNKYNKFLLGAYVFIISYVITLWLKSDPFPDISRYALHFSSTYKTFYTSINRFVNAPVEIGFLTITFLIHKITNNPNVFYFLISYFYILSIFLYLEIELKTTNIKIKILVLFIIFLNFGFYFNLYLLKQTVSVSLFLMALTMNRLNREKSFYIFYLMSLLTHKASIFTIPYILIIKYDKLSDIIKRISIKRIVYIILLLFPLISFVYYDNVFNITFLKFIVFPILLLIVKWNKDNYELQHSLASAEYIILIFLSVFYYWSSRLAWYFLPSSVIFFVTELENNYALSTRKKIIMISSIQLLFLVRQIYISLN